MKSFRPTRGFEEHRYLITTAARVTLLARAVALGFLLVLPSLAAAQQRAEVIRGTVVSEDGAPLRGADVFVTRGPDRETRTAQTDSLGSFRVIFPEGSGDYLVNIRAFGWQPFRQRLTRATSTDSILSLHASLKPAVVELDPLTATASREKPRPISDRHASTAGGSERPALGVNAALTPAQQGDIAATAALVPGVVASSGGISVLGLSPAQNNVTLNGMMFGGITIPREARTSTRVATAAYDPSRGGFSGAQTAVELAPGGYFSSIRGHVTLDAPFLQIGDEVSARLGQRVTSGQVSAGFDGQLIENKLVYSTAVQAMRSTSDAASLLRANDELLRVAGVAPDSVTQLLSALDRIGAPANFGGTPTRSTDQLTLLGRVDHTPYGKPATWGVTAYADLKREAAVGLSTSATPSTGSSRTSGVATLLANYSSIFREYFLNETKSAFTYRWDGASPYARMPAGRVWVLSELDDSSSALTGLSFGGNGVPARDQSDWTWQTISAVQWYNRNSRHRVHLHGESRVDGYSRVSVSNDFGQFTYNSLDDLRANRPASFTRTLDAPGASGTQWSGVLAASDTWRRSSTFQVLYGARIEGNRFFTKVGFNPSVFEAFNARTDHIPQGWHVSPRLGFTWIYGGLKEARNYGSSGSSLGRRALTPRGMIRGGIGEFRNSIRPDLLAEAQSYVAGTTRQLLCVGEAVPIPAWSTYLADAARIPTTCAASIPVFANNAPAAVLFARDYAAESAWRANLSLSSQVGKLIYSIEAVYSLNRNQPGNFDLNFAGTPRFTLSDEGRAVFVGPSSIVPTSGVVSPVEARLSPSFGSVTERRSDLRSTSRRVTVTLTPDLFLGKYLLSGAYTLGQARARARGFDGGAFGDPREEQWAASPYDVRHQLQLQAGISIKRAVFSFFAVLASGRPYTPLVAGDVNGDGRFNDRAFVFDPAMPNLDVANDMRALLATASPNVRNCLTKQFGRAASSYSCRGPWTQFTNAQVQISPARSSTDFSLYRRSTIVLNLTNPLGAIDQLLHGNDDLKGWGSQPIPDAVLYRVRAFDAQTRRFRYDVNPRFGETRPSHTALRMPFRITLDVQIDLGRPLPHQQLDRWVKSGRDGRKGQRLTADSLAKLYALGVPDLFPGVLAESDSLLLAPFQIDSLKAEHRRYLARMDTLWTDLGRYMASQPEELDESAVVLRQERTVDEGWAIAWASAQRLKDFLHPQQIRMLPYPAGMLARAKVPPKGIRFYSF